MHLTDESICNQTIPEWSGDFEKLTWEIEKYHEFINNPYDYYLSDKPLPPSGSSPSPPITGPLVILKKLCKKMGWC